MIYILGVFLLVNLVLLLRVRNTLKQINGENPTNLLEDVDFITRVLIANKRFMTFLTVVLALFTALPVLGTRSVPMRPSAISPLNFFVHGPKRWTSAMVSAAMKPTLCRWRAYLSPGFPKPTKSFMGFV